MTVDDLKVFYGLEDDVELIPFVNKSKGTISNWRKGGIPYQEQAVIQIRTNNKLKAELPELITEEA